MGNPLFLQPIKEIAEAVRYDNYSRDQAVEDFLVNKSNLPNVNAWVQNVEEMSEVLSHLPFDSTRSKERSQEPLNGVLVGIKDNIATRDFPTRMGTDFWCGTPGEFDARVVSKLRHLGAIVAGKTRCSEFAVHRPTGTINPRYPDSEPGTSSSGSAAAVANGEISVCLGTQTAGSIIKPASYCGVIGFKPSFGDIPRTGVLKTTELFDTVGFLGRRIEDLATVYELVRVSGRDHPLHAEQRLNFERQPFDGLLLLTGEHVDTSSDQLKVDLFQISQFLEKKLSISTSSNLYFDFQHLREAFYNTYYRDLAYFIRDQIDAKDISEELFAIFEFGMKLSDNTYTESKHLILQWQNFNRRLSGNPLILSLSTSTSAPKIGEKDSIDANIFITSAGLPQISLPILFDIDNRTVGLSFSSKRFSDKTLLATLSNLFPQDFLESYSGVK